MFAFAGACLSDIQTTQNKDVCQTHYLSVEVPVFTAALPASTSSKFFHLDLLWVFQLQGLQFLNDPKASAGTQIVKLDMWDSL